MPNLNVLKCSGFGFQGLKADLSSAQSLRDLGLENCFMMPSIRFPSSLEVLTWDNSTSGRARWPLPLTLPVPGQQPDAFETLSNLRVLELNEVAACGRLIDMIQGSHSAILTRLDLTNCGFELSDFMPLLETGLLSKLTFLGVSLPDLDDEHMKRIATGCPMLEHVELSGLRITGITVKELCSHTAIKTLILSNCLNISLDAIDWARTRGVKVVVNQMGNERSSSGRRVRYG